MDGWKVGMMITELKYPVRSVRVFETGGVLPVGLRRLKANKSDIFDLELIRSKGTHMSEHQDTSMQR